MVLLIHFKSSVMNYFYRLWICFLLSSLLSCKHENPPQSYLALGDSYTIGESVSKNDRWPVQLVISLAKENIFLSPPEIIAKTGWTADELQEGINQAPLNYPYDWVSLLIGVNNQYRGKSIEVFKDEFSTLLSQAIVFSGNRKKNVFVVSIPDWGVMPFAKNRDRQKIAAEIDNFNQAIYEICATEDIRFIDITPLSRTVSENPDWIAKDGLHPSGKQYSKWVAEILPFFSNASND